MQLEVEKLKLLHSIRGFAAFYVVIAHAKFPFWVGGKAYIEKFPINNWTLLDYLFFAADMITSNGTAMVMIFFVLSGFFIAYSFKNNQWKLTEFYFNRFLRIYIPFLASVLFVSLVYLFVQSFNEKIFFTGLNTEFLGGIKKAYLQFNLTTLLRSLIFLRNNNIYIGYNFPYWSLLYEAVFYLIAPMIVRAPLFYLIISIACYSISYFLKLNSLLGEFFLKYSLFFSLGVFLYVYKDTPIRIPRYFYICIMILLFMLTVFIGIKGYHPTSYIFAGLLAVALIHFFLTHEIQNSKILDFFKFLGKISYTMYLFHFPLFILFYSILNFYTDQYIFYSRLYWFCAFLVIPFSYIIYVISEEKSLKFISKMKKKRSSNDLTVKGSR